MARFALYSQLIILTIIFRAMITVRAFFAVRDIHL